MSNEKSSGYPPPYDPPQQGYGPLQQAYGPPQQTYGPPQQTYGPPQQAYSPPQQTFAPPQQGFGPPQQTYGPPQQAYGPPQFAFGPPQQPYAPPQQPYAPPQQPYAPPHSYDLPPPVYSPEGYNPHHPQSPGFVPPPPYSPPPQYVAAPQASTYPTLPTSWGTAPLQPQRTAPPPLPSAPPQAPSVIGFGGYIAPAAGIDSVDSKPERPPPPAVTWDTWKEPPLPPFLRETWQCGGVRVYLLQHDGITVAPSTDTFLRVHLNKEFDYSACPSRRGSLTGSGVCSSSGGDRGGFNVGLSPPPLPQQQYSVLVECPHVCHVKLSPVRGHVYLTAARDMLAFVDQGTKPCRSVVVSLPKSLDAAHLQQVLVTLEQHASLTTEAGGVLTTVTSTVESAFNASSRMGSDLIRDSVPGLYKSTKGIRKGTGTLVRLGGSLLSKGAAIVAETVAPTSREEKLLQFDPLVNQLKNAVATVKEHLTSGKVTYVSVSRGL